MYMGFKMSGSVEDDYCLKEKGTQIVWKALFLGEFFKVWFRISSKML